MGSTKAKGKRRALILEDDDLGTEESEAPPASPPPPLAPLPPAPAPAATQGQGLPRSAPACYAAQPPAPAPAPAAAAGRADGGEAGDTGPAQAGGAYAQREACGGYADSWEEGLEEWQAWMATHLRPVHLSATLLASLNLSVPPAPAQPELAAPGSAPATCDTPPAVKGGVPAVNPSPAPHSLASDQPPGTPQAQITTPVRDKAARTEGTPPSRLKSSLRRALHKPGEGSTGGPEGSSPLKPKSAHLAVKKVERADRSEKGGPASSAAKAELQRRGDGGRVRSPLQSESESEAQSESGARARASRALSPGGRKVETPAVHRQPGAEGGAGSPRRGAVLRDGTWGDAVSGVLGSEGALGPCSECFQMHCTPLDPVSLPGTCPSSLTPP